IGVSGEAAVNHLHSPDLDQAVSITGLDTCRFGIQYNLAHLGLFPNVRFPKEPLIYPVFSVDTEGCQTPSSNSSMASLAKRSAVSFPGLPLCPLIQCHSISWRSVCSSSCC